MPKIKRGLVLAMPMLLFVGAGGCSREAVVTQKEPLPSGDRMSGEISYLAGLEDMEQLAGPLEEETESTSTEQSGCDANQSSWKPTPSGTEKIDSSPSAAETASSPTAQNPKPPAAVASDTPPDVPPALAHRPVEGRLMELLREYPSSNRVADYYGLGLMLKRQDMMSHIIIMDYTDPIHYTAATGENRFYAVHRTEEGGLHFLFFKPYLVEMECALSNGVWTPLNYLTHKGGRPEGELGRWVNGVWKPWEKPVDEEIQNASPYNTVAALVHDEIYKGTYEKKQVYDARLSHAVYVKEIHSSKDFSSIQTGGSPQDVIAIDPSAAEWIRNRSGSRFYTLHMLTDGMLCVIYEYDEASGEHRVSQLLHYPDYKVNLGEVCGIESDEICDFSILPKDRFW